jgi:hypothetical protein
MLDRRSMLATVVLSLGFIQVGLADEASLLRLVPFPKRVELELGTFQFHDKLVLELPADQAELLGGSSAASGWRRANPTRWTGPCGATPAW